MSHLLVQSTANRLSREQAADVRASVVDAMRQETQTGYGDVWTEGEHAWFKYGSTSDIAREQAGHELLSPYYRTAVGLGAVTISSETSALVYSYKEEVDDPSIGLLADQLDDADQVRRLFAPIAATIGSVYENTVRLAPPDSSSDYYFGDRIGRLGQFYDGRFIEKWSGDYELNNVTATANLSTIFDSLHHYFTAEAGKEQPVVIGQNDLNDRNIVSDGTIVDYFGAGHNPLAAELATLYVYQYLCGPLAAPLMQPHVYRGSTEHQLTVEGRSLDYAVSAGRAAVIGLYFDEAVSGLLPEGGADAMTERFKMHAAMRILTVFDINALPRDVATLHIGLLARIWSAQDVASIMQETTYGGK